MSPDERVLRGFIVQLERFSKRASVERLFAGGLEEYVDLQESVFKLQVKLQKTIGEVKRRGSKEPDVRDHLKNLRWLRWQSRRLGDAIAWCGLLLNRQVIYALAKNDPVPVPSSWSDGHRGAFQFARSMTSSQWGVPIVHDVTNVLRVGDVTFMRPTGQGAEAIFRTIELKTTRLSESVNEEGETVLNLNVTAIGNEPFPAFLSDQPTRNPEPRPSAEPERAPVRQRRPDRRIERQLARMDIATASKNAPLHKSTKIGDQHVFSFSIPEEEQPHWKELRHAIRQARRDGYAYFELGGFVGYSVIYNSAGVTKEQIQSTSMLESVAGLVHEQIGDRNSITVSSVPDDDDDTYSAKVLPFYLWEVPQRAIQDILRHRLIVVATYNSGWMEKLLTDAGLTVIPDETSRDGRSFEVVANFEWEGEARLEYHSHVWEEMFVAVHEFRGPNAVIQRALAPIGAPGIVALNEFIPADAYETEEERGSGPST